MIIIFCSCEVKAQEQAYLGLYADSSMTSSCASHNLSFIEVFVMLRPIESGNTILDYKITSTNSNIIFHDGGSAILHHSNVCGGYYEVADPPTSCTWHIELCNCFDPAYNPERSGFLVVHVFNVLNYYYQGGDLIIEPSENGLVAYGCDNQTTYPLLPYQNFTIEAPIATDQSSWGAIKSMYR